MQSTVELRHYTGVSETGRRDFPKLVDWVG